MAAIISALLLADTPDLTCVAYAAPACVDQPLADLLKRNVTAVVHNDDLTPRLSDPNVGQLALDIVAVSARGSNQ